MTGNPNMNTSIPQGEFLGILTVRVCVCVLYLGKRIGLSAVYCLLWGFVSCQVRFAQRAVARQIMGLCFGFVDPRLWVTVASLNLWHLHQILIGDTEREKVILLIASWWLKKTDIKSQTASDFRNFWIVWDGFDGQRPSPWITPHRLLPMKTSRLNCWQRTWLCRVTCWASRRERWRAVGV